MQHLFELIEHTDRSIFLTGKAGTGKTTFLQNFVKKTHKQFAIAAPTGIAAINAGGVTIHSMFGLPLATFVPTSDFIDRNDAINIPHLLPHFKYRRDKLKLLRSLEILIIDEVSMLRCDVLDMLDLALRTARRNPQPFGGLQMLFIGDLYQLPPVVQSDKEALLYNYYTSPFFFEAKALQQLRLLTVSLTRVYRQTDPAFLDLLNAIRDNDTNRVDFDLLHSRLDPYFEPDSFCVHLVSHNYMADAINREQLRSLTGNSQVYQADITGEFKPHLYPNEASLELKEGAQVMFIRNDLQEEKRFFNGKLATIIALEDSEIKVRLQDASKVLTITREKWEHKRYYVEKEHTVSEEVVGSYEQFPVKLAWAVTIHKSQGLTFDKVIIDAGKSFTSGQVYVALSRCRTLEGIVLKSRITPASILSDQRIQKFQQETDAGDQLADIVAAEQYSYAGNQLLQKLAPQPLLGECEQWEQVLVGGSGLKKKADLLAAQAVAEQLRELQQVFEKFSAYLTQRLPQDPPTEVQWNIITQKCKGAVHYFFDAVTRNVFSVVKAHYTKTKGTKGLKAYNATLKHFIELVDSYLAGLKKARLLDLPLYDGQDATTPQQTEQTQQTQHEGATKKQQQLPSHVRSYQLFEQGKSPAEIADCRGITEATVLDHLAKMAAVGVLDINRLFATTEIQLFEDYFKKHQFKGLADWKNVLPDRFDFAGIRILLNHFTYLQRTTLRSPE